MPAPLWWRAVCRGCQQVLYLAYFLLFVRRPRVTRGKDSVVGLPEFLKGKKLTRPMLVTDSVIMKIGLADALIKKFQAEGMSLSIYQGVQPNPTTDQVETAYGLYKQEKCDCIIGFGGGSSMDCAKLVGVRVARPRTPLRWMRGIVKVLWPLPPIVAVPTTAGTGSEVTIAAVVTEPATQEKYALEDPVLVPKYAVLDPVLTVGMPKPVTAMTGMDALTHGVEAYLNIHQTAETRSSAVMAVRLVFNNLKKACDNPTDLTVRGNMMEAAYLGGIAFTRAYVGNVHAIAHNLGGFYGIPHGVANAIVLPYVLDYYGASVHARLARLAEAIGIYKGTNADKARRFIQAVRDLNAAIGIPAKLSALPNPAHRVREADIPLIAKRAESEANPVYPVPVILSTADFAVIVRQCM